MSTSWTLSLRTPKLYHILIYRMNSTLRAEERPRLEAVYRPVTCSVHCISHSFKLKNVIFLLCSYLHRTYMPALHIKHYTSFPAVWCLVQPVDHLGKMCIHKCSHLLTHFACSWVQFMRTHTIHRDHQQPHCRVMIGDMTRIYYWFSLVHEANP